jgi:dienelactone hydrolase
MDAEASLDYISKHSDVDQEKIFIFGTSLGGAIAIRLAHLHQQRVMHIFCRFSSDRY